MKKLITLLLAVSSLTAQAQSFKQLFLSMPEEICPLLSEYNRLELVDNQTNNKEMKTRNHFKTFSKMTSLTDTYAHLELSNSASKTFKMLATEQGENIIMVISTVVCDSVPDSSVSFYNTSWQQLPTEDYISLPPTDYFRQINASADDNTLTLTFRNPLRLTLDGRAKPQPATVVSTETLTWTTGKFEACTKD